MRENFELEQLKLLKQRAMFFTSDQNKKYYTLNQGNKGETDMFRFIECYGSSYWKIFSNFWFEHGKRMEADFIIVMQDQRLVLEVKNYDGQFKLIDGKNYLNHVLIDSDIFNQMTYRLNRLKIIAANVDPQIRVHGAVVFIGENCEIEINNSFEFEVLQRHQLKCWLRKIRELTDYPMHSKYIKECCDVLNAVRIENPFKARSLSDEDFFKLKKGIICMNCTNLGIQTTHKKVSCQFCGMAERKSDVILRMGRELRILFYDHPEKVTVNNLYQLAGGTISKVSILKVFERNYKKKGSIRKQYYEIKLD
ncbi:nuclease-related domain-containing protein [Fundicoccus sp. Sow4_H7]|uniref:nuclease-related domain-containing protein n=1 Tax=Fundicoccus sp. Sow4_H7 TaxID=3438784 RepID=UPI003F926F49